MWAGEWSFWALMNTSVYVSLWVGNSITPYLSFTVIYTTKDNRGEYELTTESCGHSSSIWYHNYFFLRRLLYQESGSVESTIISSVLTNSINNSEKQKDITWTPFVFKPHCLIFEFILPDNNPCPPGVWLLNQCRSISELNRDKQSLSPRCLFQAQTRKSIITSIAI